MHWLLLSLALAMIPVSGCITMAGNQLRDVAPKASAVKPPIDQTVGDFSFHLDGGKMVTSNKMGRELNDAILGRWKKSGFIADQKYVKSSKFSNSSVFQLTLAGHQEGQSSIFLQIISGLTLTVIPYSVDSKMDLHYSLKNSKTGCVFEAAVADSYNTVVGLLLLPASPFAQGGRKRTFDRIANNLYAQLATQGAFEEHTPCELVPAASEPPSRESAPVGTSAAPARTTAVGVAELPDAVSLGENLGRLASQAMSCDVSVVHVAQFEKDAKRRLQDLAADRDELAKAYGSYDLARDGINRSERPSTASCHDIVVRFYEYEDWLRK
jgi:hypothetical protein